MTTAIKGWRERAGLPASYEITNPSSVERALLEEVAELRKAMGWIGIEDSLPKGWMRVLVAKDCGPSTLASQSIGYMAGDEWVEASGGDSFKEWGYRVTHWMPLPAAPTSEASA